MSDSLAVGGLVRNDGKKDSRLPTAPHLSRLGGIGKAWRRNDGEKRLEWQEEKGRNEINF